MGRMTRCFFAVFSFLLGLSLASLYAGDDDDIKISGEENSKSSYKNKQSCIYTSNILFDSGWVIPWPDDQDLIEHLGYRVPPPSLPPIMPLSLDGRVFGFDHRYAYVDFADNFAGGFDVVDQNRGYYAGPHQFQYFFAPEEEGGHGLENMIGEEGEITVILYRGTLQKAIDRFLKERKLSHTWFEAGNAALIQEHSLLSQIQAVTLDLRQFFTPILALAAPSTIQEIDLDSEETSFETIKLRALNVLKALKDAAQGCPEKLKWLRFWRAHFKFWLSVMDVYVLNYAPNIEQQEDLEFATFEDYLLANIADMLPSLQTEILDAHGYDIIEERLWRHLDERPYWAEAATPWLFVTEGGGELEGNAADDDDGEDMWIHTTIQHNVTLVCCPHALIEGLIQ